MMSPSGNSIRKTETPYILIAVLVMTLASVLLFFDLGKPSIFIWDEAIYANNALEMYDSGNLIVLQRNGEYTLYNTKPPMGIWMEALSIGLFGPTEFAVRFPSALAALLTCLLLLFFAHFSIGDLRIGIFSVMILVTSYGYVRPHVSRSGDLDSMLVYWTTFYSLVILHFLLNKSSRYSKILMWASLGLLAAFYTKSIAGFLPLPGLFIAVMLSDRRKEIFADRRTYLAGLIVVASCAMYYAVRELVLPGYLGHTTYSEYSRFYTDIMPWHAHPFYYYVANWFRLQLFTPYAWFLPAAIIIGLIVKIQKYLMKSLLFWAIGFVVIISIPPNKLLWYDAPIYPILALIVAVGSMGIIDLVAVRKKALKPWLFAFGLILMLIPAYSIYSKNAEREMPSDRLENEGFTMRQLRNTNPEIRSYMLFMPVEQRAHWTQADFYRNAYNRHYGYDISLRDAISQLTMGDTVLCCQRTALDSIEASYFVKKIVENKLGCQLLVLSNKKQEELN